MRLFVAIRPSPAVRDVLLDAEAALRRQGRGTFTRPENLHLTLAFLGEVEDPASVREALAAACTGGAFSLTVGGLGRFEDLWWAGIRDNERLEALALRVQNALRQAGFSVERRPWRPHITLVRRWRGPRPRLTVPDTVDLLDRLRKDGLEVPLDALTVEECAAAITAALMKN